MKQTLMLVLGITLAILLAGVIQKKVNVTNPNN